MNFCKIEMMHDMQWMGIRRTLLVLIFYWIATSAQAQQEHKNFDEDKVGKYTLQPLLVTEAGKTIRNAKQWMDTRRPEILELYRNNVYGRSPAGDATKVVAAVVEEDSLALEGTAHRKQIEITFPDKPNSPVLHVLLYTPSGAKVPVPVFEVIHFNGNWAIVDDPGVLLYDTWNPKTHRKVSHGADVKRGTSPGWDVPTALSHGYGVAAIYYGDIEPDFDEGAGMPFGIRAMFRDTEQTTRTLDEWGAIGAWSWGMSRVLDYLITDKDVDGERVAAVGHSRLGKTVLWAGAEDQRFAMVIASCSGEGGAALSQRDYGENLDNMTSTYLYQFCDGFQRYNKNWNDLPVDAHMLLSLMAPRPLLLNTGDEDLWSDPKGEFLAAQAATPVYQLFGKNGPAGHQMPALDQPLLFGIAFHEHTGPHAILATDWKVIVDYADLYLKRAK